MAANGSATVHELQLRIRELEALRKARSEEASRIIASQRSTIDRLRAENQRLAADLTSVGSTDATAMAALVATGSAASSVMVKPAGLTPAQNDRADKLMEVADTYSRKIEVEQRQLESLEREVELAQAQLLAARRDIGGHSGTHAVTIAPVKAVKALETRLEAAHRRFNEHIAANRDLKVQIDAATRRQAGMEAVRSQLEREVASVAAELVAVHEATRVAGEAKQEALVQVAALSVSEDSEAAAFEVEVRELAACQVADERLLQAQAARLTKAVEAAEAADGPSGGGPSEPLDLDSVEQGIGVEAAALQLQRTAGLSSLPEALEHYRSLEQRSFDLFSACNEANERIGALSREAKELEAEVRQMEAESVAGRQHEAIRQVLGRRDAAVRRLEGLMERRSVIERRLAMLRTGIFTCLRKLGAAAAAQAWDAAAPAASGAGSGGSKRSSGSGGDGTAAAAAPGASAPASAAAHHPAVAACAHVMAGLAHLEQRAAAIIAVQGTMVGRSSSLTRLSGSGSRPATASLPSTGPSILAAAPSVGAGGGAGKATAAAGGNAAAGGADVELIDESDDDEDEMPLTREQIQARSASMNSR
ncbi:Outer dynein arm protein 1 [Pleodorina starrii]|uniref:Outer dynein arm protein 1 n=1 Tax=Pleodorina starrii TaxID=330485 RepID=A0A9W6BJQ8_9CHLO|nr:Outer dynein arm protein 1 [Pleodorina starrii]GLC53394.1 Outer dynein arm protein 1 [Pleodorina starrii]GLC67136.1 Outer dynein arm protein 1 [Pleodorina starrii]